jgi:MoxR-like ATPase
LDKITHLLDVVDKVRDDVALGLMSDPGLSKTSQVKQWAEAHDKRYCELIISQRMPSEISGMPMPVPDTQQMEVFDYSTLLELEDGDVLAFDEFTNGNIQTLNACLTLIQERTMLSGKKLPSLVIVAMGNPQGRCELLPQTKQRFWWVTVNWHPDTWVKYMRLTWGVEPDKRIIQAITDQYKQGFASATDWNYWTPRTMENLIRIATQIRRDDPFWLTGGIAPAMVHSIYASFRDDTTFEKTKARLLGWATEQSGITETPEEDKALLAIIESLDQCETLADLKTFFTEADVPNPNESKETTYFMGKLIAYMSATQVSELDNEVVTAATQRPSKLFDVPIWKGSGRAW